MKIAYTTLPTPAPQVEQEDSEFRSNLLQAEQAIAAIVEIAEWRDKGKIDLYCAERLSQMAIDRANYHIEKLGEIIVAMKVKLAQS